jgi:hypothetical protein
LDWITTHPELEVLQVEDTVELFQPIWEPYMVQRVRAWG